MPPIHRHADGAPDLAHYRRRATRLRRLALRRFWRGVSGAMARRGGPPSHSLAALHAAPRLKQSHATRRNTAKSGCNLDSA